MTHEELIDVCQEIGGAVECNPRFTRGLATMLADADIETLTVGELLASIEAWGDLCNEILGRDKQCA